MSVVWPLVLTFVFVVWLFLLALSASFFFGLAFGQVLSKVAGDAGRSGVQQNEKKLGIIAIAKEGSCISQTNSTFKPTFSGRSTLMSGIVQSIFCDTCIPDDNEASSAQNDGMLYHTTLHNKIHCAECYVVPLSCASFGVACVAFLPSDLFGVHLLLVACWALHLFGSEYVCLSSGQCLHIML